MTRSELYDLYEYYSDLYGEDSYQAVGMRETWLNAPHETTTPSSMQTYTDYFGDCFITKALDGLFRSDGALVERLLRRS